ncbi:hypothetical protein [Amycolatopsis sp. H20-H5]|uniref:hypothetical protein n=1 Tax=Amycolatopsis sp. H20-H5 TaxID=3046309 RepID=UPI002DB8B27F|nr:hypothetical protein [Amycolatopsis sp. H20-H5]MEC3976137.1 hypothetical protein [Amycolatopsis sp. H20-H5]
MNLRTAELVRALGVVNSHLPRVMTDLLSGALPTARQHEMAGMLADLGELLHSHAEDQDAGVIPGNPDCP